jgi:hypothetical protein
MHQVAILEVSVLANGAVAVRPERRPDLLFAYIYRAAAEVHWDEAGQFLYGAPRPEWSQATWLEHIVQVVMSELGVQLVLSGSTRWTNIDAATRAEMEGVMPAPTRR